MLFQACQGRFVSWISNGSLQIKSEQPRDDPLGNTEQHWVQINPVLHGRAANLLIKAKGLYRELTEFVAI